MTAIWATVFGLLALGAHANRDRCRSEHCPVINCVDPIFPEDECCPICPNGGNCRIGQTFMPKEQTSVKQSGIPGCPIICRCPDSYVYQEQGPNTHAECIFSCTGSVQLTQEQILQYYDGTDDPLAWRKRRGLARALIHKEWNGDGLAERGLTERDLNNRGLTERGLTDRGLTERGLTDRGLTDRGLTDRGLTDRGLTDRGLTSRGLTDRGLTDRGLTERGLTDRGLTERGLTERGLTDRGLTEKDLRSADTLADTLIIKRLAHYLKNKKTISSENEV